MSAKNISSKAIAAQKEPIKEQALSSLRGRVRRALSEDREETQTDQMKSEQVQVEQTLESLENVYETLASQDPAPQFAEALEFARVGSEIGAAGVSGGVGAGASGIGTAGAAGAASAGTGVAAGIAAGTAAAAGGVSAGAVAGTLAAAAAVSEASKDDNGAPVPEGDDGEGASRFISVSGFEESGPRAWFDTDEDGEFDDGETALFVGADGKIYSDEAETQALDYLTDAWTVAIWDVLGPTVDLNGFGSDDEIIINAAKYSVINSATIQIPFTHTIGSYTVVDFTGSLMGENFGYTVGTVTVGFGGFGGYKLTAGNQALLGLADGNFGFNMLWLNAATTSFSYGESKPAGNIYWGLGTNLGGLSGFPTSWNIYVTKPGAVQLGTLAKNFGSAQVTFVMPDSFTAWPMIV